MRKESAMRPIALYKQDCGSPALLLSCGKHREQLQQTNYSTGRCYPRTYTVSKHKGNLGNLCGWILIGYSSLSNRVESGPFLRNAFSDLAGSHR